MDIKRYSFWTEPQEDFPEEWEIKYEEKSEGRWVLYEDLQPLLNRIEFLEKQLSLCNLKVIKAREVLS